MEGEEVGGRASLPVVTGSRRDAGPPAAPRARELKVRKGIASLRRPDVVREVEDAFRRGRARASRERFRLTHYSIQGNHLHAIVEAEGTDALGRGMMSVAIRFARAVNRALGRKGRVLEDRYHVRVLGTPLQVRNAIRYVLLNARRHAAKLRRGKHLQGPVRLDLASSARWFDGWRPGVAQEAAPAAFGLRSTPAVSRARTWLLRKGWRRRGLLDPGDVPGPA